jgi:hypothetical protein
MTRTQLDANLKTAIANGTPVEVVDSATNEVYYLVSAHEYRRLALLLESEMDPRLAYPSIEIAMSEDDANDPLLESYQ